MFARGIGLPAKHPRQFRDAGFFIEQGDFRNCARPFFTCLGHHIMVRPPDAEPLAAGMYVPKHLRFWPQNLFPFFRQPHWRVSPPTLASTSSNTSTGISSSAASTVLSASITRAISPDEAMARSALAGSPGLGANWNSISSRPVAEGCAKGFNSTSNRLCLKPKSASCWPAALAREGMTFLRAAESFLPALKISAASFSSAALRRASSALRGFQRLQLRFGPSSPNAMAPEARAVFAPGRVQSG